MPRIFVSKENKLYEGWADEGVDENYDVCRDCVEDQLTIDVDYYYANYGEFDFIIDDNVQGGTPYTCHICKEKLNLDNYS